MAIGSDHSAMLAARYAEYHAENDAGLEVVAIADQDIRVSF